jgi:hypothetical protein
VNQTRPKGIRLNKINNPNTMALFGWLAASQQCFSLISFQHQPQATSQPAVFLSHNKSAPATRHQPAERGPFVSRDQHRRTTGLFD